MVFAVLGEAAEEMMRLGCADFIVAQQPVLIGRTGVQLADKLIKGGALDKKPHVAAAAVALASLAREGARSPGDPLLALTADEEVGSDLGADLFRHVAATLGA